ncbi:MAG: hypothetical protein DMD91_07485 [Candidatus Rokuibacteriota bacterium]|nr:MAG: hypothetical protein DMD91_07485 [Candidatus Rokubacteria bacterium]
MGRSRSGARRRSARGRRPLATPGRLEAGREGVVGRRGRQSPQREAEGAGGLAPHPANFAIRPLPPWPPGAADAPPVVWPEHGKPVAELIATMKATRERSRSSVEKLATLDPQRLVFKHARLGDLDLGQWWLLQAQHDRIHLGQLRDIKRARGFPPA